MESRRRTLYTTNQLDADAKAFLDAAGITDSTITGAINTLVRSLKSYNIWTKLKAVYPFVGGTASTHKWNLKDPRDLDAAFRLTFSAGWTHDANGSKPSGSSTYANTYLVPSTAFADNYNGLGYYSGTNLSETDIDPVNMGSYNSLTVAFLIGKQNNHFVSRNNGTTVDYYSTTIGMKGFFSSHRFSDYTKIYKDGSFIKQGVQDGTLPTYEFYKIGRASCRERVYVLV